MNSLRLLVGTHVFDGDEAAMGRQRRALGALRNLPGVDAVNVQFQFNPCTTLSEIELVPALKQDSSSMAGPAGGRKPMTLEFFDVLAAMAAARGRRYFAYINSDIVVLRETLEEVARLKKETFAIARHDVEPGDAVGRLLTTGLDMFVVETAWWTRWRERFRSYVIGDACWDNVYTAIMMCHSDGVVLNRDRLLLHEQHPPRWQITTATARYNGYMAALDSRYFTLWCEYWERLERGRARGITRDEEQTIREEVFVWRPSALWALQQSITSLRARLRYRRLSQQAG